VATAASPTPTGGATEAVAHGEIDVALVNDAPEHAGVSRIALIVAALLFITGAGNDRLDATIGFADVLTWDLALADRRDPIRRRVEPLAKSMDMAIGVPFEVQSVPMQYRPAGPPCRAAPASCRDAADRCGRPANGAGAAMSGEIGVRKGMTWRN